TLSGRPVGLHIDRLDDVAALGIGQELIDRIVAADRLVGAEDARHLGALQPSEIGQAPDVVMTVDGGDCLHASLSQATALASIAPVEVGKALRDGPGTPRCN